MDIPCLFSKHSTDLFSTSYQLSMIPSHHSIALHVHGNCCNSQQTEIHLVNGGNEKGHFNARGGDGRRGEVYQLHQVDDREEYSCNNDGHESTDQLMEMKTAKTTTRSITFLRHRQKSDLSSEEGVSSSESGNSEIKNEKKRKQTRETSLTTQLHQHTTG